MGRIKTLLVKRVTDKLMLAHRNKFTTDYHKNKEAIKNLITPTSKKLQNTIAGYITRLVKRSEEPQGKYPRKRNYEDLDQYYR